MRCVGFTLSGSSPEAVASYRLYTRSGGECEAHS